jgi:hypothetical protein
MLRTLESEIRGVGEVIFSDNLPRYLLHDRTALSGFSSASTEPGRAWMWCLSRGNASEHEVEHARGHVRHARWV